MIELILASIVAFASTNIDDIFILMLFFANKEYKSKQVIIGQYLGITALITISLIGSLVGLLIEQKYIGLLGLLPVFFGIRSIVQLVLQEENKKELVTVNTSPSAKTLSVAAVTFANGGDNIGIYIPFFSNLLMPQKAIMISIFLVMVGIWCFVAKYLSKHATVAGIVSKYGHIITPIVLIALGIYILYESGTFELL
jgi:cadmium resistance transport/sequestration family protein